MSELALALALARIPRTAAANRAAPFVVLVSCVVGFGLSAGCGGSSASVRAGSASLCVADASGAIEASLPAGARDAVFVDLAATRRDPLLARLLVPFRPRDPERFVRTFGFRPEDVTALAFGSYEPGELAILDGSFDAPSLVEHVGSRMNTVEIVDASPPRRVGFVGAERVDIAAIGPRRIALARENGAPMMRLLARCAGRDAPRLVDVLRRDGVDFGPSSPIRVISDLRGRFHDRTPAAEVLAELRWSTLGLDSVGEDIGARLALVGPLPAGADENLRAIAAEVADSEIGGVLGIRDSIRTLRVHAGPEGALLEAALPPARLAEGVGIVFESGEENP